jgi:hypothetical protein
MPCEAGTSMPGGKDHAPSEQDLSLMQVNNSIVGGMGFPGEIDFEDFISEG